MNEMPEKLITLLEELGYPCYLQSSLTEDVVLPESYFTFWCTGTQGISYYNNKPNGFRFSYEIHFYSKSPETTVDIRWKLRPKLASNGFTTEGIGFNAYSGDPDYTALTLRATYDVYGGIE